MYPEKEISELRKLTEKTRILALNTIIETCFADGIKESAALTEIIESLNRVSEQIQKDLETP